MKKFGKTEQKLLEKWKNKGLDVSKLKALDPDKLSPEQIEREFQAFSRAVASKSVGTTKTPTRSSCAYLDIETTSVDFQRGDITIIGIYLEKSDGEKLIQLVGSDISSARLRKIFKNVGVLHTYNGSAFDLPFIQTKLGLDLTRYCKHIDLMIECHKRGIYGGLKKTEKN